MAEWIVEHGIGEDRAILLHGGQIVAARLYCHGTLAAGHVAEATLSSRTAGSKRGTVRFPGGEEALISGLPASSREGAAIRCRISRAAIAERGRYKLAQAVPDDAGLQDASSLESQLQIGGHSAKVVRSFPEGDWEELWLEAWQGEVEFSGGTLVFDNTAAMTLIDIDGDDDARALAANAVTPIARAIGRFDLSGSIGIDFPTLPVKAERKAIDAAIAASLDHWPHERTAMNGFGFVQLVARCERPSLLQQIQYARPAAAARLLLRKAEHIAETGALLLTCHPAVSAHLNATWLAELTRRTGREVRIETKPDIALEAGFAQAVPL